jgi:hypothetical protein
MDRQQAHRRSSYYGLLGSAVFSLLALAVTMLIVELVD